jgi:hypothetical protein
MRKTPDIADDALEAAKKQARRPLASRDVTPVVSEPKAIYGLRPFAPGGHIVTNEFIDKLREATTY